MKSVPLGKATDPSEPSGFTATTRGGPGKSNTCNVLLLVFTTQAVVPLTATLPGAAPVPTEPSSTGAPGVATSNTCNVLLPAFTT